MKSTSRSWKSTVFSDGSEDFVSPREPRRGDRLGIRLRLRRGVRLDGIFLLCWPDGEVAEHPMSLVAEDAFFDWYEAEPLLESTHFLYQFHLLAAEREFFFTPRGLKRQALAQDDSFRIDAGPPLSSWSPEAVFYQIFPDRFCRSGSGGLDGRPYVIKTRERVYTVERRLSEWEEPVVATNLDTLVFQFFGGDLEGIRSKIPYLKELGVSALYLNPIFLSRSNHRYDIIDHTAVDPLLGGEEDARNLIETCHRNGIHLLFDAVLNHTSLFHPWFDHLQEHGHGAFANPSAPARQHYYYDDHPYGYEMFSTNMEMPKLRLTHPEVRRSLISGPRSALKKWLNEPFGIDGWRFDTANILGRRAAGDHGQELIREIHGAIKECNPDAYLLAETFYDPAALVGQGKYEGAMNYQGFLLPLRKWLTGRTHFHAIPKEYKSFAIRFTARDLRRQFQSIRSGLSFEHQIRMFNFLDSHDTTRFYSEIGRDRRRLRIGVTLLFTYVGIPCVYYGDEIGMEGFGDPDCRRPMIWDVERQDKEILELYRRLIALRRRERVLSRGSFLVLEDRGNLLAFARFSQDRCIVTAVCKNAAPGEKRIGLYPLGIESAVFLGFFSGKRHAVRDFCLFWENEAFDSEIFLLESLPEKT